MLFFHESGLERQLGNPEEATKDLDGGHFPGDIGIKGLGGVIVMEECVF